MPNWLKRPEESLFLRSRAMPPPWGPVLRVLRFPVALLRDWFGGELDVRAMSLAYTSMLAIVPLIAFSILILKGFGAHANLAAIVYEFFRPMGAGAPQLTASVMRFARNMRGDVLGSIGLAFLLYTVITTIHKIEASFNFVWRVERTRNFARRFSEYLGVMIVGPVLLAAALGLLASAQNSPFARWFGSLLPLQGTVSVAGKFAPYVIVASLFTAMYVSIPNTRVKFSAALIGGVVAGALWALIGKLFTAFIVYSSQMIAIYTGFAIVLMTLIWVYVSWLILLIGAQLAFYVQHPRYLSHGQKAVELTGSARELAGLSVMYLIARDLALGERRWTGLLLAEELDIPAASLAAVLHGLEQAGLLVADEHERYLPGRALPCIALAEVIDAVRSRTPGRSPLTLRSAEPVQATMVLAESAVRERLAGRTLQDLIGTA